MLQASLSHLSVFQASLFQSRELSVHVNNFTLVFYKSRCEHLIMPVCLIRLKFINIFIIKSSSNYLSANFQGEKKASGLQKQFYLDTRFYYYLFNSRSPCFLLRL